MIRLRRLFKFIDCRKSQIQRESTLNSDKFLFNQYNRCGIMDSRVDKYLNKAARPLSAMLLVRGLTFPDLFYKLLAGFLGARKLFRLGLIAEIFGLAGANKKFGDFWSRAPLFSRLSLSLYRSLASRVLYSFGALASPTVDYSKCRSVKLSVFRPVIIVVCGPTNLANYRAMNLLLQVSYSI